MIVLRKKQSESLIVGVSPSTFF